MNFLCKVRFITTTFWVLLLSSIFNIGAARNDLKPLLSFKLILARFKFILKFYSCAEDATSRLLLLRLRIPTEVTSLLLLLGIRSSSFLVRCLGPSSSKSSSFNLRGLLLAIFFDLFEITVGEWILSLVLERVWSKLSGFNDRYYLIDRIFFFKKSFYFHLNETSEV